MKSTPRSLLPAAALLYLAGTAHAEDPPPNETPPDTSESQTDSEGQDKGVVNAESDFSDTKDRKIIKKWNEYDFKLFTLKWGIYTLLDWGTALQSDASEAQVDVDRAFKVRDFRFTFKGKLATERPITYTMGLMYDGPTNSWFIRETGIQVAIPELWGNVFVGRQKEGISLARITVGYAVWTMERMPMGDATIPILVDGIKWLGVAPNKRANWNAGYYYNQLPHSPATDWYDQIFAARFAFLPIRSDDENGAILHLGVGYHWGKYADGQAQLDARPESGTAPFFLDTGPFAADHDNLLSLEAYYRNHSWLCGAEYIFDFVSAPTVGDPFFHGGDAFCSWAVTGEVRPYIDVGGKIGFLDPKHSAFEGGFGALETILHVSYTDLDDEGVDGGRFWRITPQLNWYLDSMVSLRFNYGLARLDRFGTEQFTQFFQARFQIQIE